jgi:hypothetical protein
MVRAIHKEVWYLIKPCAQKKFVWYVSSQLCFKPKSRNKFEYVIVKAAPVAFTNRLILLCGTWMSRFYHWRMPNSQGEGERRSMQDFASVHPS